MKTLSLSLKLRSGALIVLLLGVFSNAQLFACASCGSGGDDPLILYPNESIKSYLGFSRSYAFRAIDTEGHQVTSGGPEIKDQYRLALGKSFSPRFFSTLSGSYIFNKRGATRISGFGDVAISCRYTALMPVMTDPLIPQIQILAGYKPSRVRSMRGSRQEDLLDAFGSGFDEYRSGLDFWWGMEAAKFGFAYSYIVSEPTPFFQKNFKPSPTQRMTLSGGYQWSPMLKTLGGFNREQQGELLVGGEAIPHSHRVTHSYFLNQDVQMNPQNMLRIGYLQQGQFLQNVNTVRFQNYSLAFLRSW